MQEPQTSEWGHNESRDNSRQVNGSVGRLSSPDISASLALPFTIIFNGNNAPALSPSGGPFMKVAGSPQNYGTSNGIYQIPISDVMQTSHVEINEPHTFSLPTTQDIPGTKYTELQQMVNHMKAENVRLASEVALMYEERELHQRFIQAEKALVVKLEGEIESLKSALQQKIKQLEETESSLKRLQECIVHFDNPTGLNGFQGKINLEKIFENPQEIVQLISKARKKGHARYIEDFQLEEDLD